MTALDIRLSSKLLMIDPTCMLGLGLTTGSTQVAGALDKAAGASSQ